MILISHRGNINGQNPELENSPEYIKYALEQGYNVEIDIWFLNGRFFLGHDYGKYEIELKDSLIFNNQNKLWIHCKNIPAIHKISEYSKTPEYSNLIFFYHDIDQCVLTSNRYIWTYPGYSLGQLGKNNNSICVLPETQNYEEYNCSGLCSDFIEKYNKKY